VLAERGRAYREESPERQSFDNDAERIRTFLETDRQPAWNGLAIFACGGSGLFEAIPLDAAIEEHSLFIGSVPHLYPPAKVIDTFPRYAAVMLDTNKARGLVYSVGGKQRDERVVNEKTRRSSQGGWSQARYQRHVENYHLHHAKDIVDALSRIVREEGIEHVILAGDEVIVPLLREQMPKDLAERTVDVLKLDVRTPQRDVLERSLEALREHDAATDREHVEDLLDAYRSGGLGCAGLDAVRRAFELGQVDELLVPASADAVSIGHTGGDDKDRQLELSPQEQALDELVALARQTSARIRFIEDAAQLAPLGGVGAFLRFRV
jgi:peptide chain release factor subunit 1